MKIKNNIVNFLSLILIKNVYRDDEPLSEEDKMALKEWGMGDDTNSDIKKVKETAKETPTIEPKEEPKVEEVKKEEPKEVKKEVVKEEPKEEVKDEEYVKLGDKEIPKSVYLEIFEKAKKHYGEKFESIPDDIKAKLLEDSYNILEASKVADKRHQENAKERKQLAEIKETLEKEKADFEISKEAYEQEIERIKQAEEESKKILEAKPEDEFDEDKVQELKLDKRDAKKNLEAFKKYRETQEQSLNEVVESFKHKQARLINAMNIAELQENYPELKTSRPIEDIYEEIQETGVVKDTAEKNKMLLVKRVLDQYYKERPKMSVSQYYDIYFDVIRNEYLGDIKTKKPERKVKTTEEVLKEIRAKQDEHKDVSYGKGASDTVLNDANPLDLENTSYQKRTGWD